MRCSSDMVTHLVLEVIISGQVLIPPCLLDLDTASGSLDKVICEMTWAITGKFGL